MKLFFVRRMAGLVAAGLVVVVIDGQSRLGAEADAHGYYLFLDQPWDGCAACYVPLLVTAARLEDLARQKKDEGAVVLTTYERDSLVGPPRDVKVLAADISPQDRKLRLQGRRYRYQEVPATEVLALLEHPDGVLAISRIQSMRVPSVDELRELILRFRAAKQSAAANQTNEREMMSRG